MIHIEQRHAGVVPGTTTAQLGIPRYPTRAWMLPYDQQTGVVQIVLPPGQRMTGDPPITIKVPPSVRQLGPVPTDYELARTRSYMPYRKGWINTDAGTIYQLAGVKKRAARAPRFFGGLSAEEADEKKSEQRARNWAIFAAVVSALALATSTTLAIMDFKRRGKRRK